MRIIHCADVHLGSKMDSKLPSEKAEERRRELRSTFSGMVEYALNEGVEVILLAGDIFDSDRPLKKDKEFFYSVVENNPQIIFLYLRGNHDGLTSYEIPLENLKTFTDKWTAYSFGRVNIAGLEITKENCTSLYSTLRLDEKATNIVVLHGQIGETSGADKINVAKLRDKNIDYLALGHVHSHTFAKLDGRGAYAYSGCLEGRGFDEAGEKGFVLLDVGEKVEVKFVPFSTRTVRIEEVDISTATDGYTAYALVKKALNCKKTDILRVVLKGEVGFDNSDLALEIEKRLQRENYYYAEVKDGTRRTIDIFEYADGVSLKGEFIRLVYADGSLSEEKKREIVALGLRALDGREIEF